MTELKYQHLVGRTFLYGVRDCYDHLSQIYWDSFGIKLTNYARPQDWVADTANLITNLYERDGFQMITDWKDDDLRPGDVLCTAIGSSNPNHLVVYAGDNKVTHHLYGRLSCEETYRGFHRNSTCFVLRHRDVPDLRPVLPQSTLGDLLRARHQPAG